MHVNKGNPSAKLWCVINPRPTSELGDFMFQTDARGFALQIIGGLEVDREPALHPTREAALVDAHSRCVELAGCFSELADSIPCPDDDDEEPVGPVVEALENTAAALETVLAHYGAQMPELDRVSRERILVEARQTLDRLPKAQS